MKKITPHLWFDTQAKQAAEYYVSIFSGSPKASREEGPNSKISSVTILPDTPSGNAEVISFELSGQPFVAISAGPLFKFNESVSFIVPCENQEEIDYFWEKLSADPGSEQCGWCKDKFGLSWQIVPTLMDKIMGNADKEKIARVTQAFLKMKKFNIAELQKAYDGQ